MHLFYSLTGCKIGLPLIMGGCDCIPPPLLNYIIMGFGAFEKDIYCCCCCWLKCIDYGLLIFDVIFSLNLLYINSHKYLLFNFISKYIYFIENANDWITHEQDLPSRSHLSHQAAQRAPSSVPRGLSAAVCGCR